MKILFAIASPEYLRFYDATIAELATRGHDVVVAVNALPEGKPVRPEKIERLHPRAVFGGVLPQSDGRWAGLARGVRGTMDFVRYLHPRLARASVLRARMKRQALPWALQWLDRVPSLPPVVWTFVMNGLASIERALPVPRLIEQYVGAHDPDLVVVSPLVEAVSDQVDLVKAAQARGTRVAIAVASWDNLTNKGDLRVPADLILVWNEVQKREAIEFHRVRPEAVAVTGSQAFDRWFDRAPSRSREMFCRSVGLPAGEPYVLYVGSSIFISRAEAEMPFVRRWIEQLRASSSPAVRRLAVLVRPHPYNGRAWDPDALSDLERVAVWPQGGYDPVDENNRAGFFDSIYHSEAVVGINTSAMIEAAIVGRPVLSIAVPEFAATQDGTVHFHYLLPENGGFLRVGASLEEHVRQLDAVLAQPQATRDELARFVASFVRPHGIDRACTPIVVETLERHAASPPPAPARVSAAAFATRMMAWPLTVVPEPVLAAPSRRKVLKRRVQQRAH
jgi:hypothetical protein